MSPKEQEAEATAPLWRAMLWWLLAVAAVAALALAAVYVVEPMDGYGGWVLSHLVHEDTVYAPGYSDWGFRRIRVGMSEAQVRQFVGEPLEVYKVEEEGRHFIGWRYARSAHDNSYRIRAVLFCEGGVVEVFREFYLD